MVKLFGGVGVFSRILQKKILLSTAFFISLSTQAQKGVKFEYLTTNEGLVNNGVTSFTRDTSGFLWIGTSGGLSRFDGTHFVNYLYDTVAGSLSNNWVRCLMEDSKGSLWVGTNHGLNLYSPDYNNFKTLHHNPEDDKSIGSNQIITTYEDPEKNIWIGTYNGGLNKWNPEKENFTRYKNKAGAYGNCISSMAHDSRGDFWIVTYDRGINRFDSNTGKFTLFNNNDIDFGENTKKDIFIDNNDMIWIATTGAGLIRFNSITKNFKQYNTKGDGNGTNKSRITSIIQEDDNHLLIGVDQGGINRLNIKTEKFEYLIYDESWEKGLNNNGIWELYKDEENILWVGTTGGGVNYYNPKSERFHPFHHSPTSNSVSYDVVGCLFEDSEGKIWIGTDGKGVNVYDPQTGNFKIFTFDPQDKYSISSNVIRAIDEDSEHNIWIATWDAGLNMYNRKTKKFHRYLPDKNIPSAISGQNIWTIKVDHNNIIWISLYNKGIELFDKDKGVVKQFTFEPNNEKSLASNTAWLFHEDEQNNMWVCTKSGVCLFDSTDKSFVRYNEFPDNNIWAFHKDCDGNLWAGTSSRGIFRFDSSGNILETYNTSHGLSNNIIKGIAEDNNENLWISTNHGLNQFNRKDKKIRFYTTDDGLPGNQFFFQSFLKDRNEKIYFGGYNGFIAFSPNSLTDNDYIPFVYLSDFLLFNKPVVIGAEGSPLKKHISQTKSLTLSYKQSVFTFHFRAVNMTYPLKCQFAYRMEGLEKEWNYVGTNSSFATYRNLKPGKYTFRVIASNNDLQWNNRGVNLNITITPPWWKTTLFIVIYSILFIFTLLSYVRIKVSKLTKSNTILNQKVRTRTKQLEEQNRILNNQKKKILKQTTKLRDANALLREKAEEIKQTNTELQERQLKIVRQSEEIMLQRDMLYEYNTTKDMLFSIIAHDLRNPFGSILNICSVLSGGLNRFTQEELMEVLAELSSTAQITYDLLEKLLKWSMAQKGAIHLEPSPTNLVAFIKNELQLIKKQASEKEIDVKFSARGNERLTTLDVNLIGTVIRNLISNAIKFSHTKGVIYVEVVFLDMQVRFSVQDEGVGMQPEQIDSLFKITKNKSTRGTVGEKGTGLGLLLCNEFIKLHKGKIWAESTPGEGSKFIFTIPVL